jgi:hypothetical protein
MSGGGKTTGRSGCGRKGWDGREEMRGNVTSTSTYQRRADRCARFHETNNNMGTRMLPSLRPLSSRINSQLLRTSKPKPKPRPVLLGLGGLLQSVSRAYRAWLALFSRAPGGLQVGSAGAQGAIHRLAAAL